MKGLNIIGSNNNLIPFLSTKYSKNIFIKIEAINVKKNFAERINPSSGCITKER